MGQFLSSTFWEGSPAAVWHEKLHDAEHKGDGETIPALQDHVMCSEEREHGSRYREVHITQSLLSLRMVVSVEPRCDQEVLCHESITWGLWISLLSRLYINN